MIKYEIKEKDGYLNMTDLPYDCIFNKVRTGCGGTSIALQNDENYVIAVPTTEQIVNKCNSNKHLFGLYGNFTPALKEKLICYTKQDGRKKIMCTYDKLPKLEEYIDCKEYRLLIDEYHNLLKQYIFRSPAIDGVLDNYKKFKSFCFMSATPIEADFKPEILKDVPELIADWKEEQTLFIAPFQTNKPYQYVVNIINSYKENGAIIINGEKSDEAFFFLNSVKEIADIIKKSGLTNDNCRVICADDDKNRKKLGDIEISNSISPNKQFNFITCKSFEGADFFSETGLCFVVSNVNVKHTLASIDIDIPQIAGRIRTRENPFRNTVIHIFNTKKDELFNSYEEVKEEAYRQLEIAKEMIAAYNLFSPGAKKQQAKDIKYSLYIRYANNQFEVNDRAINYTLYEYKLMHQIYSSSEGMEQAYQEKKNVLYNSIIWQQFDADQIKKYSKSPTFLETAQKYYDLKFSLDNSRMEIERKYPFICEAFQLLGLQKIRKLRTKKAVQDALIQAKIAKRPNHEEMFRLISNEIELGRFYVTGELKDICIKFRMEQIKELREWYDIESGTKRIDGVAHNGYWIKAIKA